MDNPRLPLPYALDLDLALAPALILVPSTLTHLASHTRDGRASQHPRSCSRFLDTDALAPKPKRNVSRLLNTQASPQLRPLVPLHLVLNNLRILSRRRLPNASL